MYFQSSVIFVSSLDAVMVSNRNASGLQFETITIAEKFQGFLNRFHLECRLLVEGPHALDLPSLASLLLFVQDTSPESNDVTLWDDICVFTHG